MQELRFELAHLTLSGLGLGDPNKPMILALHGWLDNAASFIPLSEHLSDFYIVALDITGHGNSAHRALGNHYHLLDFVQDIHELVESQGWPPFILLGHSMGGIIASLYASCFNDKVSKLISIESFGPITKDARSSPQQLRESIESRIKANQSQARHPSSLEQTIAARARAGDMSLLAAGLLVERNVGQKDGQYFFKTDRKLRTFSSVRITEEQAEAFMRNITCPMLVVHGDRGFEFMRAAFKHRQNWVTQLTAAECSGHHHVHMDNPEAVAQPIREFLTTD
ncbi:alpha/beta fold hydrolase [Paraglaciecola hydrolytica]|uniref:Alpha/beta hydrolase n=1 Tax=Paraglaciecola hydrolytica TaxID=1799789 RepID=A0A136A0E1_9ALTE|nr:alpha/beta hydrolase [Paraglaciecola hydrolytica]KXI28667.1 alpha/beta hydrolase [Paraglaciecola hydrolytica]